VIAEGTADRLPIEDLTPRQIVAELDQYIVGQAAAKRAVAVALRNRYRRQQLPPERRDDVLPKNILMIGPTGVGKTEIARRLAQLARAPFVKVEATKFTEVGYVGRDVDSMVRELVANAVRLVEREIFAAIRPEAERRAEDRLVDLVYDGPTPWAVPYGFFDSDNAEDVAKPEITEAEYQIRRAELREQIRAGAHASKLVEIETEEAQNPFVQVFSAQGIEEMGIDTSAPGGPFGTRRSVRRLSVADALPVLVEEESRKMVDRATIHREAIYRAEQTGIIFIDEIDKVAIKSSGSGPDVSREGVQRDLLPIIEGSTVQTKFGPVKTDHVLFVAAGAFHIAKPSDLIPELQGRLPIRVQLEALRAEDFRRILREPKNALTGQYADLLAVDGVSVEFTPDALDELAALAMQVNEKIENIGARRLHTMMELLLEDILFHAPDPGLGAVIFDGETVRARLEPYVRNLEVSRNVL
jgi:ATP-dependent HslUV protease ATP-binding subunit HslU